jgi:sortase A
MLAAVAVVASALILLLVAWQAAFMRRIGGWGRPPLPVRPGVVGVAPVPKGAFGRFIYFLGHRRWARRTMSACSGIALLVAIGIMGFPVYTNLVQSRIQARLDRELASPALRQEYLERRVKEGESLTRVKIPAIGVDVVVVEGTGPDALRAGAGHYRSTPLPCENGNVAIAGHRTTYGRPFHNMDLLKPGDKVTLETPIGSCTYVISAVPTGREGLSDDLASFIVGPTDISVVANSVKPMLTLTSCHPKGSAAKRIVIQATLESNGPAPTVGS